MVTASACAPVLPDWPATTGSRIARAVNCAMVSSKRPTTKEARKAVSRLICSHGRRFLTAKANRREGAFVAARADHGLHVGGGLGFDRGQHRVVADDADEVALEIHDRQGGQVELLQELHDLGSRRHGPDADRRGRHQLPESLFRVGQGEILNSDRSAIDAVVVHDVEAADSHVAEAPQLGERRRPPSHPL